MAWRTELTADARADQRAIFVHLVASHRALSGATVREARDRAVARVRAIDDAAERLALTPRIGTLHGDRFPGLRHVTRERAVFWFALDETARVVRVLGIFGGGQDHERHMMRRLGADP
ncbi:MAG: type II toxin-antitoxin system RelE/ParE family toxin [Hasllibacter sp.]